MRVFGIFSSDQMKQRLVLDFITADELSATFGSTDGTVVVVFQS